MNKSLIAPCGINCGLCIAYLREKNKCLGCLSGKVLRKSCMECKIKKCENHKKNIYCYNCFKFPCDRIKHLDKRYTTKYHTSVISNLKEIKEIGIKEFEKKDKLKWKCKNCGETLSMHKNFCLKCNKEIKW